MNFTPTWNQNIFFFSQFTEVRSSDTLQTLIVCFLLLTLKWMLLCGSVVFPITFTHVKLVPRPSRARSSHTSLSSWGLTQYCRPLMFVFRFWSFPANLLRAAASGNTLPSALSKQRQHQTGFWNAEHLRLSKPEPNGGTRSSPSGYIMCIVLAGFRVYKVRFVLMWVWAHWTVTHCWVCFVLRGRSCRRRLMVFKAELSEPCVVQQKLKKIRLWKRLEVMAHLTQHAISVRRFRNVSSDCGELQTDCWST